jgi:hypothetical protein
LLILANQEQGKMDVPRSKLPKDAREGSWVKVEFDCDEIKNIILDAEETERAKTRITDKLARLRRGAHRN